MSRCGMVMESDGKRSLDQCLPSATSPKKQHTQTPPTHPTLQSCARASCMLSQEAAKKGKDAMLNEHKRHQIELNSMRQSSRKQHQKLKELLPALLAPWPQHCCRRRDLERAYRNKAASLHPDKRGCHEAFCGLHSCAWPAFRRQGQAGARDWSRSQLVRVLCPLPPISTTAWMWCTVARCWLGPGARAGLPRIKAVKGLGSWKALTAGSFQRSAATSSLTRWNAAWQFSETGCSISACLSMRTLGHALQNEYVNIASYKMAVAFLLSRARPTLQPPSNHLHPDHVESCWVFSWLHGEPFQADSSMEIEEDDWGECLLKTLSQMGGAPNMKVIEVEDGGLAALDGNTGSALVKCLRKGVSFSSVRRKKKARRKCQYRMSFTDRGTTKWTIHDHAICLQCKENEWKTAIDSAEMTVPKDPKHFDNFWYWTAFYSFSFF